MIHHDYCSTVDVHFAMTCFDDNRFEAGLPR
jgi:hypothetical protein